MRPPARSRLELTAQDLMDLDLDLMKLLMRRSRLLSRLRGGKDHASTPAAIQAEKSVRLAWEKNALSFSKDTRFSRQLFSLLQELSLLSREDAAAKGGFHLTPSRAPLAGTLTGPADAVAATALAALYTGRGAALRLENAPLSLSLQESVRALSQAGGAVTLVPKSPSLGTLVVEADSAPSFVGKTLFAGDSPLLAYLLAFLAAAGTGTCRLTGGRDLKEADLSPLRHMLPQLGARLAHTLPHSKSVPASLECSGILPGRVAAVPDLPAEGLLALFLAAGVWNRPLVIDCADLPAQRLAVALQNVQPALDLAGLLLEREADAVRLIPGDLARGQTPALPLDPCLAAYLLALPAWNGGTAALRGAWPAHHPAAVAAADLLAWPGLALHLEENMVTAAREHTPFSLHLQAEQLPDALLPLLTACAALEARGGACPVRVDLPAAARDHARDFLAQLGFRLDDQGTLHPATDDTERVAWIAPDAWWGMAFALCALARPGLLLANPERVTELYPGFWQIYNSLPVLADPPAPDIKKKGDTDEKPGKRRFIAG